MAYLFHSSKTEPADRADLRKLPALRKATEQMLWAYASAHQCVEKFPTLPRSRIALVVGSGQGEQETTKEYYKTLAREGMARPFLFQNSLHHSTAGMLCQSLGLEGAAITVSDAFFSGEAALDIAMSLLEGKQALACLVVGVDTLVPDFAVIARSLDPPGFERGEGAAALLIAGEEARALLGQEPRFRLSSLRCERERLAEAPDPSQARGAYEADFPSRLHDANQAGQYCFWKPDGSRSLLLLEAP